VSRPVSRLPEPKNLSALKAEVQRRWGTIDLLDILKDTAFITDFTGSFASVASREVLDRVTLNRRLLLVLFALRRWLGLPSPAETHAAGSSPRRRAARSIRAPAARSAAESVIINKLAARAFQEWKRISNLRTTTNWFEGRNRRHRNSDLLPADLDN
jgi:hypothetical protein